MKKKSKKRWLVALGAIVVILFVARPGANRLKSRIVNTMSLALGRQVEVSSIHFHVLPRPGFDLTNLVVHDDPTISAEPMLQAGEVSAALRLRSLLRGRLEVSRLSISEPSVNLARTLDGRWNLEGLVERAAKSPVAPTSKSGAEPRPGFPYIEASRARINIKLGQSKKAFALTDADLAVWQELENEWGVRLRAQPVRTDFNLTDTGQIRVDGTWQRAATLQQTPLDFQFRWQDAQLGALTKLLLAKDAGWRGAVAFSAAIKGLPSDLAITAKANVGDFRRYDILGGGNLKLATECSAHFDSRPRDINQVDCRSVMGEGTIRLAGNVRDPLGSRSCDLTLTARKVPAQALANLARRAKKGLPEGLTASGTVDGTFTAQKSENGLLVFSGSGQAISVDLGDSISDTPAFEIGTIKFVLGEPNNVAEARLRKRAHIPPVTELQLTLLPFPLSLGRPTPALAEGSMLRHGYRFRIVGESQTQRAFEFARLLGISASHPAVDGAIALDMRVEGNWTGFAAPQVEGTAAIRSVRVELPGTSAPIEISAGVVTLDADGMRVEKLTAKAAAASWVGQITVPRSCEGKEECFGHFSLAADTLSTEEIGKFFTPASGKRAWYRLLSGAESSGPSPLLTLRATGTVRIGQLLVHKLTASKAQVRVEINQGRLRLEDLGAQVLGGNYRGNWTIEFGVRPPTYSGNGAFEKISLDPLTALLGGPWAMGTGSGTMQVKAAGYSLASLRESSEGVLTFNVQGGKFNTLRLHDGAEPLSTDRFAGELLRHDGKFEIRNGKLQMPDGIYQVSGTITSGDKLDLKLARVGGGYIVNGTLIEPRAIPDKSSATQAALKP